jgi:hypothetical protein
MWRFGYRRCWKVSPLAWTHLRTRGAMARLFGRINCSSFVGKVSFHLVKSVRVFLDTLSFSRSCRISPARSCSEIMVLKILCRKCAVLSTKELLVYSKARMNTRHPVLLRITVYKFITIHLTNSGQVARYTFIYILAIFCFYQQIVMWLIIFNLGSRQCEWDSSSCENPTAVWNITWRFLRCRCLSL